MEQGFKSPTLGEMIAQQEEARINRIKFVCGICGGSPDRLTVEKDSLLFRIRWRAECCKGLGYGAGELTQEQRNAILAGKTVEVLAIAPKGVVA